MGIQIQNAATMPAIVYDKIRVTRKGKTWNHESKISSVTAKVIAKFLGRELPTVAVYDTKVKQETPEVEVKHVSTTKVR